ncbi:hypothetical protein NL676_016361 [Syzygium grande]|nr:hypothetical protein NL676_016361 [Syzygium grande]
MINPTLLQLHKPHCSIDTIEDPNQGLNIYKHHVTHLDHFLERLHQYLAPDPNRHPKTKFPSEEIQRCDRVARADPFQTRSTCRSRRARIKYAWKRVVTQSGATIEQLAAVKYLKFNPPSAPSRRDQRPPSTGEMKGDGAGPRDSGRGGRWARTDAGREVPMTQAARGGGVGMV